jgi:hypothetical protein
MKVRKEVNSRAMKTYQVSLVVTFVSSSVVVIVVVVVAAAAVVDGSVDNEKVGCLYPSYAENRRCSFDEREGQMGWEMEFEIGREMRNWERRKVERVSCEIEVSQGGRGIGRVVAFD